MDFIEIPQVGNWFESCDPVSPFYPLVTITDRKQQFEFFFAKNGVVLE